MGKQLLLCYYYFACIIPAFAVAKILNKDRLNLMQESYPFIEKNFVCMISGEIPFVAR